MEVTGRSWVRSAPAGPPSSPVGAILALDASTDRASAALDPGDGPVLVAPAGESRRHGRGLLPSVRDLLHAAGLRPADLGAIGVGLGPGSFTGLRIALTAAKALAYAVGCPLVGFDSLEAIARGADPDALLVAAVADAQRGDLFAADFARDAPGGPLRMVRPSRLERADSWPSTLAPGTVVVGPAIGRSEPDWPASVVRAPAESGHPDGRHLIGLTREHLGRGEVLAPWFLEPAYVRRSAAEEKTP